MAETVLVRTDITPELIEAGRSLLIALDTQAPRFDAALWLMNEESGRWRLVLASRNIRKNGSVKLYQQVAKVIEKLDMAHLIWIGMISIVDLHTPIVEALRQRLGTAASVDGARLDDATIGSTRILGCVLYRLSAKQKLAPRRPETIKSASA